MACALTMHAATVSGHRNDSIMHRRLYRFLWTIGLLIKEWILGYGIKDRIELGWDIDRELRIMELGRIL